MKTFLRPVLLLIALLTGLSIPASYAQSADIDSLKRQLINQPADTNRVRLLNRLSRLYLDVKPDTTYRLAQQAYRLAQQLDDKPGQARGLNMMGTSLSSLGDYPKSIRFFQQSLQISRSINDLTAIYRVLNNMANPYQEQKDYKRTVELSQESFRIFKQVHGKDVAQNALLYATMYGNLGEVYLLINQLDSSEYYLKKALFVSERPDAQIVLDHTFYVSGDLQFKRHKPAAALAFYRQGLTAARQNNTTVTLADIYLRIAAVYQTTGPLDSCLINARRSLISSQQVAYLKGMLSASQLLAQIYDGRDNTQALRYYKVAVAARDSLFSQEKVKQLLTLDFEEQQRQQELQVARETYQNRLRIYGLSALIAVVLLVSGLLWRTNQRQKATNQQLNQQKEEIDRQRGTAQQAFSDLQAAQTQLIHQEKMASLGELTAGIAHEIQNPLNFVNNFSEVSTELVEELREGPLQHLPPAYQEEADELLADLTQNLEKITTHGQRASGIVRGMLAHSRTGTGEKRPTDLNTLAQEYLHLAYQGLRAKDKTFNVTLVTDFDPGLNKITVVPQELGRVLLNLYNNAFYAVHQKQELQLAPAGEPAPESVDYQPQLTVRTRCQEGQVAIIVEDNGMGMPESVQAKIFQPFFTTKPTGEGTGLGLSLSYDIITQGHGGTLTVESREDEGTTFTIHLTI